MAFIALVGLATMLFFRCCAKCLSKDEQLRIQYMTDLVVLNGPGLHFLMPFTYRSAQVVKAETLGTTDYVKVKDTIEGSERIEKGPKLFFLGAYEKIEGSKLSGLSLSDTEYVLIED